MKFLVDNQLPTAVARWISSKGHDAVHVLDVQLAQSKDKDVWDYAQKESRIIKAFDNGESIVEIQ